MSKRNKNRILTMTSAKVTVRDGELPKVFNRGELQQWHDLINKIKTFDDSEMARIKP